MPIKNFGAKFEREKNLKLFSENLKFSASNFNRSTRIDFSMNCRRLRGWIQDGMKGSFFQLGYTVASYPLVTIALSIVCASVLSIGLTKFYLETEGRKLWVPQDTLALDHSAWVEQTFPVGIRPEQLIVHGVSDIATKEYVLQFITLAQQVYSIKTEWESQLYAYEDVCAYATSRNTSHCAMLSVLDVFYDDSKPSKRFLDNVQDTVSTLSDVQVKSRLSRDSFYTWNNVNLTKTDLMAENAGQIQAFRMMFFLKDEPAAVEWEKQWAENLYHASIKLDLQWDMNTIRAVDDAVEESIDADMPKFIIGYVFLAIYVCTTMGELNRVQSRILVSLMSFVSVGLALVSTVGICSAFGMFFGPVHQMLPLLLLGIGIDDAFVILTALDRLDTDLPVKQRIACSLSQSGTAITVTSLTNACVFFIGSFTGPPALSTFALWAGIGILFDAMYQSTFLVAWIALDAKRQRELRCDLFICVKASEKPDTNIFGLKPGVLARFFHFNFGPLILNGKVIVMTMLLTIGVMGYCVYGITLLRQDFRFEYLYLKGTYAYDFTRVEQKYFAAATVPLFVYTGALDYADQETQMKMNDLFGTEGYLAADPYVIPRTMNCWYQEFRLFANMTAGNETIPSGEYYVVLSEFLNAPVGSSFRQDLILNDNQTRILASRTSISLSKLVNEAMYSLRAAVDRADLDHAFAFTDRFIFFEQEGRNKSQAVQSMIMALATVFLVSLFLIGNLFTAIVTFLGVGFSVVDILGIMYFWDIQISSTSNIALTLAVGLTIDFSAHIGLAFMEATGKSRYERVLSAMANLGPPLLHGGISTLLAVSVLSMAVGYAFIIFFRMFILIIGFGMFHGMIVVPQILSLVGPKGYNPSIDTPVNRDELESDTKSLPYVSPVLSENLTARFCD